jgi:prolyl-tRNA synthetase
MAMNWLLVDLAEKFRVRGCMVIKPYGYAIWEKNASGIRPNV